MNGSSQTELYDKTYYTALARERYVQMSKINIIINLNKTITVTFDPNGGDCDTPSKEVTYNSTYGTLPEATREGYEWAGWYTATTKGNKIDSTTKVNSEKDHTLYARWKSTVNFDSNGGTEVASREVVQGSPYGQLEESSKTGYNFVGWFTDATGGDKVKSTDSVPSDKEITLYAHWSAAEYMVDFNANGGSVSPTSKSVTYNETYGELPTPIKTGYTFDGWYTAESGGTIVTASTPVNIAQSHTLYAHWTIITYTVAYDANGGTGAPSSQTKTHGEDLILSETVPTKNGYNFLGWSTNKNATTATYQPKGKYTANSGATLYAVWSSATYTVTFNANGGSVSPTSQSVTYNGTYGTLPTPVKTGYTFAGWYTAASGGSKVTSSTTVTATANHILYAHWTANTYTISYDANGGSGAPSSQTKTYGTDLTLSSKKPTKSNYTFLGWAESKTATEATYKAGGKYTKNGNKTLYAVWQKVSVTSVKINQTEQWIPTKAYSNVVNYTTLTATVSPSNALNKNITWSSSNTSVATVNSSGKVTAVSAGKTTITVTSKDNSSIKASINVYVYNAVYIWEQPRQLYGRNDEILDGVTFPAGQDYLILDSTYEGIPTNSNDVGFSYYCIRYSKNNPEYNCTYDASGNITSKYYFRTYYQNGKNLCSFYDVTEDGLDIDKRRNTMTRKKQVIVLIVICVIITILSIALFKLLKDENKDSEKEDYIYSTATLEERIFWSDFLKRNSYLSEIKINEDELISNTVYINLAISSEDVELEYITEEEIEQNETLSLGDGYKKSKKEIEKYLKETFNKEAIQYNFIETYVENDKYLIIAEDYVYFTKIELPEKEYILINLEKNGNEFKAEIYEYEVNESNRTKIQEMLESGTINKNIETSKIYTITGTMENENICILTKT